MSKREAIKERRKKRQQQQRMVTLMMIVGVALILAAILMLPTIRGTLMPVGEFEKPEFPLRPMVAGNTMGDPNAPVTMVIFSDFGCSHCGNFAQDSGEKIAEDYVGSGQVYMVYRSTGSLLPNPSTAVAAEAAYCAADQNSFWQYHDLLFANQITLFSSIGRDNSNYLNAFAEYLNLDMNQFEDCLDSGKYNARVIEDENEARTAGINSTPSFLVNGRLVVGNVPYSEFQLIIESELAAAQN